LALRGRYLPSQRSFQPPHLGFAAFDHLFPPNQMAQANHTSGEENTSQATRFKPLWRWYKVVSDKPVSPGYHIVLRCMGKLSETISINWVMEKDYIRDVPRDYRCPWDRRGARLR